jgi:hypothetical protein
LVLRYYAGLPQAQIATAMGISTGAVKGHISRAMTTLRGPEDIFGLATRPGPSRPSASRAMKAIA